MWKFYLYWLLHALRPTFTGFKYQWYFEEYKITSSEYGLYSLVGTVALLAGIASYQVCFKHYEFRHLAYATAITFAIA